MGIFEEFSPRERRNDRRSKLIENFT